MLLLVLTLSAFAVATAEFVLVGLLPAVAADLGVSVAATGQLVTVYMLVVTVGGPAATLITRRVPRRRLLAGAMLLATASAALCAVADTYPTLLAGRIGSALAQAVFLAVASQVAMATSPAERQTAAVARVFAGFALATVIGLPLGTLIGDAYGWHTTFVAVAALAGLGLLGILVFCPRLPGPADSAPQRLGSVLNRSVLPGQLTTLLTLTGFVAVFTYAAPMLSSVSGFGPAGVSAVLVGYGAATVAGNLLAGRVRPEAIAQVLPVPVGVAAVVLLVQGMLLPYRPAAVAGLVLLGGATFVVVPLVQTWLMRHVDPRAAGLAAAVNISVAGIAGTLGAGLGGLVLATGLDLRWISPLAALPVTAATVITLRLRRSDTRAADRGEPRCVLHAGEGAG